MNASNTHTFTASASGSFTPAPREDFTQEQGRLEGMVDWLVRAGFEAVIARDCVEVQDPYQLSTGGRPPVIRYETARLRDLSAVFRFLQARR